MHVLNILILLILLPLVGVEFSVSAFVNPSAWRLEPEPQRKLLSQFAAVLGKVMPFWYSATLVLLGMQTWLHRHTPEFYILLTASMVWVLSLIASLIFLVPLNNRVAQADADWQQIHRTWDKRHRMRVAALVIAAVLLTYAVAR